MEFSWQILVQVRHPQVSSKGTPRAWAALMMVAIRSQGRGRQ
jgi:hypothetical protein